jgi:hypothetical protein
MATTFGVIGRLHERSAPWGRVGTVAAAYALMVGAASLVAYLPDALGGESAAVVRVSLGVIGTLAGLILWLKPARAALGWRLALIWAALQIPVIAWNEYGNATLQLLEIPLKLSQRTTYNGVVTSYSELGINLLACLLAGIYGSKLSEATGRFR